MTWNFPYICRSLLRNWTFTIAVVLTLALGLGANAAVLIFANTLLFHSLPYANSDRVVNLWSSATGQQEPAMTVSPADFFDWQRLSNSFEAMAAFNIAAGDLVGRDSAENVAGAAVTQNFFKVLGIQPIVGRSFAPGDGQQVIVLSYNLWKRDFDGATSIIGQKLILGGTPYTIVGVMPRGFVHPEPLWDRTAEFWRPMPDYSGRSRGFRLLRVIARLKPNISPQAGAVEMQKIGAQLAREYPEDDGRTVLLVPLRRQMFGDMYQSLFPLFFVAGAVLLIASANVTNLQLARANSRFQQVLIRLAMGAKLRDIVFLIFGESSILTIAGTALGIPVGYLALRSLQLVAPSSLRGIELISIDGRLPLFACILVLVSTVLIGLPPVLRLSRYRATAGAPQNGKYEGTQRSAHRIQSLTMAIQIALVLPLLITTSLLARSFMNLMQVDPGFQTDHLLTLRVNLPQTRYATVQEADHLYKAFLAGIKAVPGVREAALTSSIPLTAVNNELTVGISQQQQSPTNELTNTFYRSVTEDYLQAMGMSLRLGRQFRPTDNEANPRVAIINSKLMRDLFQNENPLGKTIFIFREGAPVMAAVIGVTTDIRSRSLVSPPAPEIYVPFAQDASLSMGIVVRTAQDPARIVGELRRNLAQLDNQLTVRDPQSMEQVLYGLTSVSRFAMLLMIFSSFLALSLALIGVAGTVAYVVSERTREFAIRMAIGATHADIVRGLALHILKFALSGIAVGIVLATSVKRIPGYLLYELKADHLVAFTGSSLVLVAAILLAGYLPVRRIVQINTADLLRTER